MPVFFWRWGSGALAAGILIPLLIIFGAWLQPATEIWAHLAETVLPRLIGNTLILMAGVAVGTTVLGVGLAWLVSAYRFPGSRIFDWALMLPLAVPAYVMAFVFLGLMDFQGPAQEVIRTIFGLPSSWFLEVRNPIGVLVVMTLVLYPYVYMLSRATFLKQGMAPLEAARTMGMTSWESFRHVALPMARPAIIAGVSLAIMEALADFGAVAVFNFDTFTTAIYKAWFGFYDLRAASQLASMLLAFAFALLLLERYSRARARYTMQGRPVGQQPPQLRGVHAALACGFCSLVLLLAFLVPMLQLLIWAWTNLQNLDQEYLALVGHTLLLGAIAAAVTTVGAFVIAYAQRQAPNRMMRVNARISTLGYAVPGSVLAVAVMLSLSWIDRQIAMVWEQFTGVSLNAVLVGSVLSLVLAYYARFLALAFNPIEAGLEQIKPHLREAAQSLGLRGIEIVRQLYLPMLRPGLLTAALLVMVDVMKEMPATLLLRPYGWDTLAIRIHGLSSEGLWERAALPAVTLVLIGLIPVFLLSARSRR